LRIEGAPKVDEFVFFHERTRTLVVSDLVFNVIQPKGVIANVALLAGGCRGRLAQSRAWRFFVRNRTAAAASARALLATRPEALVVAHGDLVETGAHEKLERALAWMCAGDALDQRSTSGPLAPQDAERPSRR
jgi:hypothetical protein